MVVIRIEGLAGRRASPSTAWSFCSIGARAVACEIVGLRAGRSWSGDSLDERWKLLAEVGGEWKAWKKRRMGFLLLRSLYDILKDARVYLRLCVCLMRVVRRLEKMVVDCGRFEESREKRWLMLLLSVRGPRTWVSANPSDFGTADGPSGRTIWSEVRIRSKQS